MIYSKPRMSRNFFNNYMNRQCTRYEGVGDPSGRSEIARDPSDGGSSFRHIGGEGFGIYWGGGAGGSIARATGLCMLCRAGKSAFPVRPRQSAENDTAVALSPVARQFRAASEARGKDDRYDCRLELVELTGIEPVTS